MLSSKSQASYRDMFFIGVLIVGVCFLTLTPSMYLVFHALQWETAVRVVEMAFPPTLLLALGGGLLAYQRAKARRAMWDSDNTPDEHP